MRSAAVQAIAMVGGGVAGHLDGQHGGVDDAQPGDTAQPQPGVGDIVGVQAHGAGADGVVAASAGVQGITHHFVGAGHGWSGEVLVGHVVGQRTFGEQLARNAERRRGGCKVGVVFEGTRVDERERGQERRRCGPGWPRPPPLTCWSGRRP